MVALPLVLMFWGFAILGWWNIESSLSSYYYLRPGDALVGVLVAVSLFLITYRGRQIDGASPKWLGFIPLTEARTGDLAGIAALLVAFFPNRGGPVEEAVHTTAAIVLFIMLAYFCIFHFTKIAPEDAAITHPNGVRNTLKNYWHRFRRSSLKRELDPRKIKLKIRRNWIYFWCGIFMLLAIVTAGVYGLVIEYGSLSKSEIADLKDWKLVFWCEAVALWAFGISWFIKGQTFWGDDPSWWKIWR